MCCMSEARYAPLQLRASDGVSAWHGRKVWWVDPVGAILISCYIVYTWIGIASEQMDLMVRWCLC